MQTELIIITVLEIAISATNQKQYTKATDLLLEALIFLLDLAAKEVDRDI